MPVYRTSPEHLRDAISSILGQTFTDFEFLILDDCPEDDREAVVKSFNDARIKYSINAKNEGISRVRNRLIDLAKGEYLAIMDHDDISLPERFAEQVAVLDANPEIGVVGSWFETFPVRKLFKFPEDDDEICQALTFDCFVRHPASMIRKSVLVDNGIRYEEEFSPAEDYALWGRLIGRTRFCNIPKVLFRYRIHCDSVSNRQFGKMADNAQRVRDFIRASHPDLKRRFDEEASHLVRLRLFGVMPCGKFIQRGNRRKGILRFLPFVKFKAKYICQR